MLVVTDEIKRKERKYRVSMKTSREVVLSSLILPAAVRIPFYNRPIQSAPRFLSNQTETCVFKQHLQFSVKRNVEEGRIKEARRKEEKEEFDLSIPPALRRMYNTLKAEKSKHTVPRASK